VAGKSINELLITSQCIRILFFSSVSLIHSRSQAIAQNVPQKMTVSTQVKAAPAPVQKLKRNQYKKNTIEFRGVLPKYINT
jgi:hypothetical protein